MAAAQNEIEDEPIGEGLLDPELDRKITSRALARSIVKDWRCGDLGAVARMPDGSRFEAFGVQISVGEPERPEMPMELDAARECRVELPVPFRPDLDDLPPLAILKLPAEEAGQFFGSSSATAARKCDAW